MNLQPEQIREVADVNHAGYVLFDNGVHILTSSRDTALNFLGQLHERDKRFNVQQAYSPYPRGFIVTLARRPEVKAFVSISECMAETTHQKNIPGAAGHLGSKALHAVAANPEVIDHFQRF